MKKFQITEEQIKQLFNNKEKDQLIEADLKNWFPEIFKPKLEVGKWYIHKDEDIKFLFFLEGFNNNGCKAYGFDKYGYWSDSKWRDSNIFINDMRLAENEEVEQRLIEESVKRGYKVGTYFESLDGYKVNHSIEELKYFTSNDNINLHIRAPRNEWSINGGDGCSNPSIFKNGKWAEIVNVMTRKEAEEKLNCKIVD